uniref:Uncharacterized protein n=1 Tax=Arundo donax TaxID=35708 RepID=A0A0A8Z5A4_ARUDO
MSRSDLFSAVVYSRTTRLGFSLMYVLNFVVCMYLWKFAQWNRCTCW